MNEQDRDQTPTSDPESSVSETLKPTENSAPNDPAPAKAEAASSAGASSAVKSPARKRPARKAPSRPAPVKAAPSDKDSAEQDTSGQVATESVPTGKTLRKPPVRKPSVRKPSAAALETESVPVAASAVDALALTDSVETAAAPDSAEPEQEAARTRPVDASKDRVSEVPPVEQDPPAAAAVDADPPADEPLPEEPVGALEADAAASAPASPSQKRAPRKSPGRPRKAPARAQVAESAAATTEETQSTEGTAVAATPITDSAGEVAGAPAKRAPRKRAATKKATTQSAATQKAEAAPEAPPSSAEAEAGVAAAVEPEARKAETAEVPVGEEKLAPAPRKRTARKSAPKSTRATPEAESAPEETQEPAKPPRARKRTVGPAAVVETTPDSKPNADSDPPAKTRTRRASSAAGGETPVSSAVAARKKARAKPARISPKERAAELSAAIAAGEKPELRRGALYTPNAGSWAQVPLEAELAAPDKPSEASAAQPAPLPAATPGAGRSAAAHEVENVAAGAPERTALVLRERGPAGSDRERAGKSSGETPPLRVLRVAGSSAFLGAHAVLISVWLLINLGAFGEEAVFDPKPFPILLGLVIVEASALIIAGLYDRARRHPDE